MGNAGRVLMIPKGEYNSATTYEMLDCVYYNGRSYVCKQTSTGNVPTNTTYWQAMTPDSSAEIQALTNEVRGNWATGGVNKLPNTGTTDTKNGVTATYADDGRVTLNASSASTNISDFPISSTSNPFYLKEGTYILSGGASSDARLYIRTVASSSAIAIDSGNGAEFTVTSEMASGGFAVYLNVASGKTFDDVVISPMIADADYSGGYQPYAKTNVELTQDVATLNDVTVTDVSSSFTGVTSGTINMIKCGKVRQLQFDNVAFAGDATFPTLDTADRPKAVAFGSLTVTSDNTSGRMWLRVNGTFGTGNVLGKTVMGAITWIAS